MRRIKRRHFLLLAGGGIAALAGLRFGLPYLLRPGPLRRLDDEAREFVETCFGGIDRSQMWDTHVHLVGLGAGGTGCWINREMQSHLHPLKRLQYDVYTSALGMDNAETADADYVARLLELQRQANPEGKLLLMAFDQQVGEDGEERPVHSSFYTPNDYALDVASRHEELVACASIHPYRHDALDRLDAAAARGARAVKWLPNAMGIDPMSPRCDAFYRRLVELRLPLISHAGHEYAVDGTDFQELGNPLRLRRALDAGVRVIVAHAASFGANLDLDADDEAREPSFDLFMRMFTEAQYEGSLFADISALTAINRRPRVLRELLRAPELHHRLLNGSDYPLPALGPLLFNPGKLRLDGLLGERESRLCKAVGRVNPLLLDFVLKRSIRVDDSDGVHRFADRVFETSRVFENVL